MKMHLARVVALVLVLGGSAAEAQSLSELMEKAIYTEETLGNVEGAIRIYEQIINGSVPGTDFRQQALRRLESARVYFKNAPRLPLGTFDGRTYRHTKTGLSFSVPPRWIVRGTHPSATTVKGSMSRRPNPRRSRGVDDPRGQRCPEHRREARWIARHEIGRSVVPVSELPLSPGSIQRLVINGKQAIMAIADFGEERPYVEYLTWIYTERTHTFFLPRSRLRSSSASDRSSSVCCGRPTFRSARSMASWPRRRWAFGFGGWSLPVLLLIAVVVPSACVLWFMNEAVEHQAAATRQAVADAYRGQLRLVRGRFVSAWRSRTEAMNREACLNAAVEFKTAGHQPRGRFSGRAGELDVRLSIPSC